MPGPRIRKTAATGIVLPLLLTLAVRADGGHGDGSLRQQDSRLMIARQEEPIEGGARGSGLMRTYLGTDSYPQANLQRISNGHLQIIGPTGAWASQTDLLTVVANQDYANDGNQGGFWDPNYRLAYGGQDGAAVFIAIAGRRPILRNAEVQSFGKADIKTPTGLRTVYTVVLKAPFTASQLADLQHRPLNLRVETNTGFFGYLIPHGFSNSAASITSPGSSDGATLVIDNWVCASCTPPIPASAGATPPPNSLVTIDALHQIDDIYGGWRVVDGDGIDVAMNIEQSNVNNRPGRLPPLNLLDPLSSKPLLVGRFDGVVADTTDGQGAGVAHDICSTGWQACFIARNMPSAKTGNTYGFVVPTAGPDFGFYSTQRAGYVLAVDPQGPCDRGGRPCERTVALDSGGNLTLAGLVSSGSITSTGTIAAEGPIIAGRFFSGTVPVCSTESLGAHIYVLNGRKPGERSGLGSGTPADCTPPSYGSKPFWTSVYDRAPVTH